MKIALYRASAGNIVDHLIDDLTGRKGFSHCEILFSDGWSFSSTTRDKSVDLQGNPKPDGTRFKLIDYDPAKWVMTDDLGLTAEQEAYCRSYAHMLLNARYDYEGVIHFVCPIVKPDPWRYFCSKAVVDVAQRSGQLFRGVVPYQTSPNDMSVMLKFHPIP